MPRLIHTKGEHLAQSRSPRIPARPSCLREQECSENQTSNIMIDFHITGATETPMALPSHGQTNRYAHQLGTTTKAGRDKHWNMDGPCTGKDEIVTALIKL